MKETLKVPLKEYENLRDLFQFLEANGMEQEKKQVMEMTEYIDYVDGKLSELLSELSEVKSQLSNIQNRSLKTAMESIVGKIEEKAHHRCFPGGLSHDLPSHLWHETTSVTFPSFPENAVYAAFGRMLLFLFFCTLLLFSLPILWSCFLPTEPVTFI